MLEQICEHIHNYFILDRYEGECTVDEGTITPVPGLTEGQRFWLTGSALNDGVYTYHADGIRNDDDTESAALTPETFCGTVCGMGVPKEILKLASEVGAWMEKYGDVVTGPYTSESFGGYSYTKASSGSGADAGAPLSWQNVFRNRMNPWRKACL